MIYIDELDNTKNFWQEYPQMRTFPEFNELWKKDRSKNKKESSNLLWAFAFVYYPLNNMYYNLPNKKDEIAKNILRDEKFDWLKYKKEINLFQECCTTEADRSLVAWEEKMKERSKFIEDKKYDEDTYKMLDTLMSNTPKMYEDLENIKKRIDEQRSSTTRKGSHNMNADDNF
jgi:hypothetical protein